MLNQRKWEREEDWELIVWFGSWSSPTFLHHVFTNISSNCLGMYTATNYISIDFSPLCVFRRKWAKGGGGLGVVWFWKQAERPGSNFPQAGLTLTLCDPQHNANGSLYPSLIHGTMQMQGFVLNTHTLGVAFNVQSCTSFLRPDLAVVHEDLYIVVC